MAEIPHHPVQADGVSRFASRRWYFAQLDLLRGVAALAVILYHERVGFAMLAPLSTSGIGDHAYLAVDFFFQLSGFVIAAAYDARLRNGMSRAAFVASRLARLYPLIFASLVCGALAHALPTPYQVDDMVTNVARGLLLIPVYQPGTNAFPLNFPLWSIFFELLANVAFVFLFRRLTMVVLASIVAAFAVLTIALVMMKGSIDFGAGYPGFPGGFARTGMSFFGGVLLFRVRDALPTYRLPPIISASVLAALLLLPVPTSLAPAYDVGIVLFVFPLVIALAASTEPATRVQRFLGEISYPLYVVHVPVMAVAVYSAMLLGLDSTTLDFGALTAVAIVAAACIALKAWDEPIRRAVAGRRSADRRVAPTIASRGEDDLRDRLRSGSSMRVLPRSTTDRR